MLRFLKTIYQRMLDPNLRWYLDTLPTGANAIAATGAGAWAYGAYVQIIAATAMDLWIVGVELQPATVNIDHEAAIAVGPVAAPVDLAVLSVSAFDANVTKYYNLPFPLYIQLGERLSCRCRDSAGGATVVNIKLQVGYYI